ncbi:CYTH domain-containing protein [Vagococcus sp. BWB3-3]|uniref:CYTH domain-containing protein n=1 Tax=Vagococcus allomyrinae TaxID=2794353 RepID=A0A940ST20_9ENTE|nr:CYTH domain-containing protein [Vagococcus allomyrinae]MBP1039840.1 CYTH domain-containing protein [Vagococcus allomyrinae]
MGESIEIEYKSLLTQEEYQRLLQRYVTDSNSGFTQTNVYYDTPDFALKALGMGLRIRLMATKAEFTLKSPLQTGAGLLETTDELTLAIAEQLVAREQLPTDGEVVKKLALLDIPLDQLVVHGQLTTKRIETPLTPTILLVLDESWYHGKHDYELEMEVSNALTGKDYFVKFLNENAIDYKVAKNKIVRTFDAKVSS